MGRVCGLDRTSINEHLSKHCLKILSENAAQLKNSRSGAEVRVVSPSELGLLVVLNSTVLKGRVQ